MSELSYVLRQLHADFTLTDKELHVIAAAFRREMAEGLAGRPSSLAMLPSSFTPPTGQEKGVFLALDFGGTNVRALVVELLGRGRFTVFSRRSLPLVDPAGSYNLIAETATAEDLFNFLATQLGELTNQRETYLLGHTFSFPCRQTDANHAVLLHWTKEIKTSGVEGHNIAELLNNALLKQGLSHIRPVAILNDTISTLIAAAYGDSQTDIGSICGTGHNTCYLEANHPRGTQPVYINIESGNFDKAIGNAYDALLDSNSESPGTGRLEKMCSGRYIGELFRLVILNLGERGLIFDGRLPSFMSSANIITGETIAEFLADTTSDLAHMAAWLQKHGGYLNKHTHADLLTLQAVAALIVNRSARLVAATYNGVLNHIDPDLTHNHTIVIDGSLYEKMPGYAKMIDLTMSELLGDKSSRIQFKLTKDGSGVGAAVAAATKAL